MPGQFPLRVDNSRFGYQLINPASIAAAGTIDHTLNVKGAKPGSVYLVSLDPQGTDPGIICANPLVMCNVAGEVTLRLSNITASPIDMLSVLAFWVRQ